MAGRHPLPAADGERGKTSARRKGEREVKEMDICHFVQCRTLQRQVSEMGALLCHQPPWQGEAALTFIAVAHRVEVDVVLVAAEEEEAEPGVEGIDGHDEEDADDVALLLGDGVIPQVCVDLQNAQRRAVAVTTREGNQRCPHPGGLQEACPMSSLLPGVTAPLVFHHRPIAMNRHMRQAPSQSPGQSLPQKHMEIGSIPRGCARSMPSSMPAPWSRVPVLRAASLPQGCFQQHGSMQHPQICPLATCFRAASDVHPEGTDPRASEEKPRWVLPMGSANVLQPLLALAATQGACGQSPPSRAANSRDIPSRQQQEEISIQS